MTKIVPFPERIRSIVRTHGSPVYVYDERGIRDTAKAMQHAFSWNEGYQNHFAVKALPNRSILKILAEEGMGTDASSLGELILSCMAGITGEDIMFTSNNTHFSEFERAAELGAIINFDDLSHVDYALSYGMKLPSLGCFRFNPGTEKQGNAIIGEPKDAKYGLTREQIHTGYRRLRDEGVKRFGLHTMVVSNMLDSEYLEDTARMLFSLVRDLHEELGITFEFVDIGGGLGIPYKPTDAPLDINELGEKIRCAYDELIIQNGHPPLAVKLESGRYVTGPHGYLVTTAQHVMSKYKEYVGVDACMANLMRPGMYDAYHHISVLGKNDATHTYDVVGSLCENNDKFAIDRALPHIEPGDILVIHDAGAHGHSMGFNYNAKLRCAEVLARPNGDDVLIRRAETLRDYFSTQKDVGL